MNTAEHGGARSAAAIGVVLWGLVCLGAAAAAAVEPCPEQRGCAEVAVRAPVDPVGTGNTAVVRLALTQGPGDLQPGGLDEIAALTLTLGIPGLELADCAAPGPDGLNPSFALLSTVAGPYRAIVQNLTCAGRPSCLCPSSGESRDEYVNLLLIGSRNASGVPPLPNGDLLGITVRVTAGPSSTVPLHIFSALDDPVDVPRPAQGAWLSVADHNAVDRTVDTGGDIMNVRVIDGELKVGGPTPGTPTVTVTATQSPATATASTTPDRTATASATVTASVTCAGDCDGTRMVSVNELITGVGIALGALPLSSCPIFDCTGSGQVDVSCLVAAVNSALDGCPEP